MQTIVVYLKNISFADQTESLRKPGKKLPKALERCSAT
jgi:hypothetical protein